MQPEEFKCGPSKSETSLSRPWVMVLLLMLLEGLLGSGILTLLLHAFSLGLYCYSHTHCISSSADCSRGLLVGREKRNQGLCGAASGKPVDHGGHRGAMLNLSTLVIREAERILLCTILLFYFYRQNPKRLRTKGSGAIFWARLRHWERSWRNEKKLPWLQPLPMPV